MKYNEKYQRVVLRLNRIIFWWYYKRVPEFFHSWTILKSISILKQSYEHQVYINKGLDEVISNASKREVEMRSRISNLELKLRGVPQSMIDPLNKMLGTDLKGKSNEETNN